MPRCRLGSRVVAPEFRCDFRRRPRNPAMQHTSATTRCTPAGPPVLVHGFAVSADAPADGAAGVPIEKVSDQGRVRAPTYEAADRRPPPQNTGAMNNIHKPRSHRAHDPSGAGAESSRRRGAPTGVCRAPRCGARGAKRVIPDVRRRRRECAATEVNSAVEQLSDPDRLSVEAPGTEPQPDIDHGHRALAEHVGCRGGLIRVPDYSGESISVLAGFIRAVGSPVMEDRRSIAMEAM
jgi:hypothetical protein